MSSLARSSAKSIAVLPLRHTVLFPDTVIPITVSRKVSIQLIKAMYGKGEMIGVLTQRDEASSRRLSDSLYQVGTLARILKVIVLADNKLSVIMRGAYRFRVLRFTRLQPHLRAMVNTLSEKFDTIPSKDTRVLFQELRKTASETFALHPDMLKDAEATVERIRGLPLLVHFLSSTLPISVEEKQSLLEIEGGLQRAQRLLETMRHDLKVMSLKSEIQDKTYSDIDRQQRDYFIRQQIKVLQNELGGSDPEKELDSLAYKGSKKKWRKEVAEHFDKELERTRRMTPATPEYSVALNYLEFLIQLPWSDYVKDKLDLRRADRILSRNHYGIPKVKERLLEYLAIMQRKEDAPAPILCLCGPPGVGKTSLGRSISQALGRPCVRVSLGGMHDEAEIRGHRRTYIGAQPGRIIQQMAKVKYANPVFILDELDKVQRDYRGDPSAALLEALDPEQNHSFVDNYVEVGYDLSKTFFIATANTLDTIQPALRDRVEVIEMSGYTLNEKMRIASRHLIRRARMTHGVSAQELSIVSSGIRFLITRYTRESGVRELYRKLSELMRKVTKRLALRERYHKRLGAEGVRSLLGLPRYDEDEVGLHEGLAGVAVGLAWTYAGGEILYIESCLYRGRGKLILSGQLGDVMRESAMTSLSYLRTQSAVLDIPDELFSAYDLHVHVPAGAVPKDGPSAGITMLSAMASAYTQRPVRRGMAMTGEITLSGKVLAVGGIKEKIIAASVAGRKTLLMSTLNKKDVDELEESYTEGLTIHYVDEANEVLRYALAKVRARNARALWPVKPLALPAVSAK